MTFIDSHCHLDFSEFDCDRAQVISDAKAKGMETLIIPGVEPAQWPRAKELAEKHNLFWAAGLHPWWIQSYLAQQQLDLAIQNLLEYFELSVGDPRCVALGECGLDASLELSMPDQQVLFGVQVEQAQAKQLPLIIHSVKAHAQVLAVLKEKKSNSPQLKLNGVIHAFSGSYEQAKAYWDLGFYLGIGGVLSYERAQKTRRSVAAMPLEALVLETDAPAMPLAGQQGLRNSPKNIPQIARVVSELHGVSEADILTQCCANTRLLFPKMVMSKV
jgi:TatD DNase family protein